MTIENNTLEFSADDRILTIADCNGAIIRIPFDEWENLANTVDTIIGKALKVEYDKQVYNRRDVSPV